MTTATPRVGGQALADGVLMRTDRAWAIARSDGSVEVGEMPRNPLRRLPVLRVFGALVPAFKRGRTAAPARTDAHHEQRRHRPARFLAITGAQVAVIALATQVDVEVEGLAALVFGWGLWLVVLVALRRLTPRRLLAFHGAEHKAVRAFESGVDLADVDAVLRMDRTHPRCGTHVLFWLAVTTGLPLPLPTWLRFATLLAFVGVWAEVLGFAARRPAQPWAHLVLAGGHALQRWVTTVEPDADAQRTANAALQACLGHHTRLGALAVTSGLAARWPR